MNKVILMGRLTRDPEVRYSAGDNSTAVARYTLAVNRRFKRDNEPTADLFRVWRSVRRRSLQRNGFARECRLQFLEESRQGATPTERAERSIPLR